MPRDLALIVRSLARLAVDYFKWSQLVPMIVAWGFLLFAVALLAMVNFQERSFTIVEALVGVWERFAWLPRLDAAVVSEADGTLRLNDEGFRSTVLGLWSGTAALLFMLGRVRSWIWGPPERPAGFPRRMTWVAAALAVVWGTLLLIYLFGAAAFQGGPLSWILLFTGTCLAVGVVSAYSLGVAFVLDLVSDGLSRPAGGVDHGVHTGQDA